MGFQILAVGISYKTPFRRTSHTIKEQSLNFNNADIVCGEGVTANNAMNKVTMTKKVMEFGLIVSQEWDTTRQATSL